MAGDTNDKDDLIARLAATRARLQQRAGEVRHALDVPTRVRVGFQRHAGAWLSGAVLAGVLIAKLPPRTRKVRVDAHGAPVAQTAERAGIALATAKIAFDLARPILLKMAMERLRPWIERRFGGAGE